MTAFPAYVHSSGSGGTATQCPPPHIVELQALFDALDASDVLAELHSYRRRTYGWRDAGRRGYGPEALWRAYIASFHLNLDTTNDLIRRLQEDPALAEFCDFGPVLPHRTTFNRFIQRLAHHGEAIQACLAALTDRLREHYPDLGGEVAIDSTVVEAYANRNHNTDPDASWTAKTTDTGEKEWFYGYKLHLLADSRYEVPLSLTVTTASHNDTLELSPLVEQAGDRHSWFQPYAATADKGYDSQSNHEFLYDRGILPIIPLRNTHSKESRGVFTENGIPTCIGNMAMKHVATNGQGHRLYQCPKRGCNLKDSRPGGVNYCDTAYWLDPRENLRLCGAIERESREWKKLYGRRQAVERVFKSLKEAQRLERHNRMGLTAVRLHALMSVLTYQAYYLAQARAEDKLATRPWMVRKVA